jgi:hypothetical protein
MPDGQFICPECGAATPAEELNVSTSYDPAEPRTAVLHWIRCGGCRRSIPAHLGERWRGMTVAAAQAEWRARFRDRPPASRGRGRKARQEGS